LARGDWHRNSLISGSEQRCPLIFVAIINLKKVNVGKGFTLVEVMIVVATIAMLAAIVIPGFMRIRENAQNSCYAADIRVATTAFIQYSIDFGHYPPDANPAVMPTGMDEYLKKVAWTKPDVLGGKWDWDNQQFGIKAGVSSYQPTAALTQLQRYDAMIDDGDLSTGQFRARTSGYITVIEE
jgi:prepilin-type N-terminal cleavage/methylation domain-containing protein